MRSTIWFLIVLIAMEMISCQPNFAGNNHHKNPRKKNARSTAGNKALPSEVPEQVNTDKTNGQNSVKSDRKDVWIPSISTSKLKEEWDHGYSTGFWNSMSEAPVERARAAIVAGFYFQKLFAGNPDGTFYDVGGG